MDDPHVNAASAGRGESYVTTGLLQKANDDQLRGGLAHKLAHDDLGHVAKAQTLGAGVGIGMIILDQIFPGSGHIAPMSWNESILAVLLAQLHDEGRAVARPIRKLSMAERSKRGIDSGRGDMTVAEVLESLRCQPR